MVRSTGRRVCLALLAASLLVLPWRPLLASPADDPRPASTSWIGAFLDWFDVSGWGRVAAPDSLVPPSTPHDEPSDPQAQEPPSHGDHVLSIEEGQDSGPDIDPNG